MSVTDELLANNASYAAGFSKGDLAMPPAKKVAIVACMDARLDPARVLGLEEGDAHVIRNVGGVITDDAIRSLTISQRLLGTEEIILIHHTDCGMLTFADDEVKTAIVDETGIRPHFAVRSVLGLRCRRAPVHSADQGQSVPSPHRPSTRLQLRGRVRTTSGSCLALAANA